MTQRIMNRLKDKSNNMEKQLLDDSVICHIIY